MTTETEVEMEYHELSAKEDMANMTTETKHTPGAMRAANKLCSLGHPWLTWEEIALAVDNETNAPELLEALREIGFGGIKDDVTPLETATRFKNIARAAIKQAEPPA